MVIVNVTGEPFKRYVVDPEDEHLFDHFEHEEDRFVFGAQAIRRNGIDEQYRLLSTDGVFKVTRK